MKTWRRRPIKGVVCLLAACCLPLLVMAQEQVTVLAGSDLTRVVPPGFYFQGLTAPTQMRNSAAARFGSNRHVIAGLVDTSGYSADVREKYQGFLITDSQITINGTELRTGAYGFGFTKDGKLNVLDLAGNEILTVSTMKDTELRRPRPLMMTKSGSGVRLYSGRDYAQIETR